MGRIVDRGVEVAFAEADKLLKQGRAKEAAQIAVETLQFHKNQPAILRQLGVSYMILGLYGDAVQTLQLAIEHDPRNPAGYEQLGNLFVTLRRYQEAIDCFEKALPLAPAKDRISKAMSNARSLLAQDRLNAINGPGDANGPTSPKAAMDALYNKDIAKARIIAEQLVASNPDDLEGLNILATIKLQMAEYTSAEELIRRAIQLHPSSPAAHANLGHCLQRQLQFEEAVKSVTKSIMLDPQNPDWHFNLGNIYVDWDREEEAQKCFEQALAINPDYPQAILALGHVLQDLGDEQKMIATFKEGAEKFPGQGEFSFSLANLKTYSFSQDEIDHMQLQVLDENISENSEISFHFALGKAFEDAGDFDMAFHYFKLGNDKKRSMVKFDSGEFTELVDGIIETFSDDFIAERSGWGCQDPAPILIVGLPRSGSTLVEQIVSTHNSIDATRELAELRRVADTTASDSGELKKYPWSSADVTKERSVELGQAYIDRTFHHRRGAPHFTDKLPNNFLHIGFLHMVLPNAKVLDARRHPLDTCLSTWKQLFGMGQMFSYSLEDIRIYYRQYVRLMEHWDKVLPGKVLRCQYEDVVDDLESSARKMLQHCGLEWDDSVLKYYESDRVAKTASSEQVKQPIYKTARQFWRNYEAYLEPLISDLGTDINIK